jgi:integrase
MALRKIHNTYYIYFRDIDGKIKTRSLKTTFKDVAEKAHTLFMRELQSKKSTLVVINHFPEQFPNVKPVTTVAPPAENNKRLKLADMVKVARKNRDIDGSADKAMERFIAGTGKRYADEITPEIALKYLDKNYGDKKAKTYNNIKCQLNTIFRLCRVPGNLDQNPFEHIAQRLLRDTTHYRALTQEEFVKIFKAAAEPWKSACLISWHTALRAETCFRLAWEHINIEDRSITIMPGKTARFGRAVYIPIHPELWSWLCALPRPKSDKTPILSQWGKYIHFPGHKNQTYIAGLYEELGIDDTNEGKATFHSIRASFITRCDEAGIIRRATRGIVGHVNDNMTDLYSHDKETAKKILDLPAIGI